MDTLIVCRLRCSCSAGSTVSKANRQLDISSFPSLFSVRIPATSLQCFILLSSSCFICVCWGVHSSPGLWTIAAAWFSDSPAGFSLLFNGLLYFSLTLKCSDFQMWHQPPSGLSMPLPGGVCVDSSQLFLSRPDFPPEAAFIFCYLVGSSTWTPSLTSRATSKGTQPRKGCLSSLPAYTPLTQKSGRKII